MEKDFQNLVNKARASKHIDAILLLMENKTEIQKQFSEMFKNSFWEMENDPQAETIKKTVGLVAEYVFNSCVEILSNDKKDE